MVPTGVKEGSYICILCLAPQEPIRKELSPGYLLCSDTIGVKALQWS